MMWLSKTRIDFSFWADDEFTRISPLCLIFSAANPTLYFMSLVFFNVKITAMEWP